MSDRAGDAAAGHAEQVGESLNSSFLFSFVCKAICLINEQNTSDQLGRRGCGGRGPRLSWRAWWRGRSRRAGRGRGRGGHPGHSGNISSRNSSDVNYNVACPVSLDNHCLHISTRFYMKDDSLTIEFIFNFREKCIKVSYNLSVSIKIKPTFSAFF